VPQVGCFDTAFHAPSRRSRRCSRCRALSAEGIKRYGFHGLSYDYVARQLPQSIRRARPRPRW
jgi:acetate kinase